MRSFRSRGSSVPEPGSTCSLPALPMAAPSLKLPRSYRMLQSLPPANAKGLYMGGTPVATRPHVTSRPVKQQKTEPQPTSPSVLSIEVYQGDKKPDIVKFPEQNGEEPK